MIFWTEISEAVARRCSVKKVFLKISQNSQERTCARVSVPATLLKKRLTQAFSSELWEFFKNTFFTEHARATDSEIWTFLCISNGFFNFNTSPNVHAFFTSNASFQLGLSVA